VTVSTLMKYLLGDREAILRIANCRGALWIGLIFVLSAGLAREYDGADLVHDPWIASVPVAASLATSFLLYALVRIVVPSPKAPEPPLPFWAWYRKFLGLYWATAPLAWLYAIPVERFMTPGNATRANFLFLAIVSVWRVSLMTRVISVLWKIDLVAAFWTVMLFADSVAIVAVTFAPKPVFDVMGGVRLSERENFVQGTVFLIGLAAFLSWLIWLIGTLVIASRLHFPEKREPRQPRADEQAPPSGPASRGLWGTAVASVLIWAPILPFTQPEQINRRIVESQLRHGQIAEAIAFLWRHSRQDFPPLWDPPPQLGYGEDKPGLIDVLSIVASPDLAPPFREIFAAKLMTQCDHFSAGIEYRGSDWEYRRSYFRVLNAPDDELARFVSYLRAIPEGPPIAYLYRKEAEGRLQSKTNDDPRAENKDKPQSLTPRRKELLKSLHALSDDIAAQRAKPGKEG
jgi:hypothetical protein